jgi:uncharacterized phage-associated protein
MFCERKVAQMATYLLHKEGGAMSHMKLLKLMYLADRTCYKRFDRSMSKDNAVSMDYGPVLSNTYSLMGSKKKSIDWSRNISPIENNKISLTNEPEGELSDDIIPLEFGELSRSDIKVLDEVHSKYEDLNQFDLSKLTHDFPEWQNPHGSSIPISVRAILQAVGKEPEVIEQIMEDLDEIEKLEMALAEP